MCALIWWPSAPNVPACPLELTAKELGLLAFFLNHPGEILSRTRIYGQVWGEDYDFVSNTLDVHIKELQAQARDQGITLDPDLARPGISPG